MGGVASHIPPTRTHAAHSRRVGAPLFRALPARLHRPVQQQQADKTLTVMMPEITEATTLGRVLRSPNVLHLKARLFFRPEIVVTTPTLPALERALPLRPKEIRHRFIVPIAELDRPRCRAWPTPVRSLPT